MNDKKWTGLVKFIVEELGKEPFKLECNVSSFASLNDQALLAVFHKVLCEIDPKYGEECQNDPTFVKGQIKVPLVMELLRVLRYWAGTTDDPDMTNEALGIPIQETVWEIMAWLLIKKEEHQERVYLSQFLVKVQVPEEMMLDDRMTACYIQYEHQIELFKETHKKLKEMKQKMERRPVNELVKDLGRIGHDIECLSRKVDAVKNKVEGFPEKAALHIQAVEVRKERETKVGIRRQFEDEQNKLVDLIRKQEVLSLQLNDLMDLNEDGNPDTALNRLEQDSEILKHIVEEKLPRQIELVKRKYLAYRITEENPPLSSADLEFRKQRMEEVSQEIQFLKKTKLSRNKSATVSDPVLAYAKEQVARSAMKKLDLAKKLQSLEQDFMAALKLLDEGREKYESIAGGDAGHGRKILRIPGPEEYKAYVQMMRGKAPKYKEMRSELSSLQAELGHLSITKYIVDGELKHSQDELMMIEERLGVVGLSGVQSQLENISDEKSKMEIKKVEGIEGMSKMAKELNAKLADSKTRHEKILSSVKGRRKDLVTVEDELERIKTNMKIQFGPLQQEIEDLEKSLANATEKYETDQLAMIKLESEIPILKTQLNRTTQMSGQGPYARSHIELVRVKVVESERMHQELKVKAGEIDQVQEYERRQKEMWSDLSKLFQVKVGLMKRSSSS